MTFLAYVGCRTTPDRNGRGRGLGVYALEHPEGAWTPLQLVEDLVNPSYLAMDRQGRVLYVVHGDRSEVSAFRVDPASGRLAFLNGQSTHGRNPVHLAVDPTNRFLVVANYATGSLALLPIEDGGRLGRVCDLVLLPGETGPHRFGQTFSHPHQVLLAPDESRFLVPDKGLDALFTVRLDPEAGRLRLAEQAPMGARPGAGPRHAAFHPDAPILYVLNELDSTITTCELDANGGPTPLDATSMQPSDFFGENSGAAIAVLPSGRFAYATNRGSDRIAILAIDPATHRLAAIDWVSSQGRVPRFMTLGPSGTILFVANEGSDTIVSFRVDPSSGALEPTGRIVETGSPVCILFAER